MSLKIYRGVLKSFYNFIYNYVNNLFCVSINFYISVFGLNYYSGDVINNSATDFIWRGKLCIEKNERLRKDDY